MQIKNRLNYIRFGQVFKSLENYSAISVIGSESKDYLHKQLTSNVEDLLDNSFQQSAVLDIKGRLVSSFYLLKKSDQEFILLVDEKFIDSTLERMNLYLVSEDVDLSISNENFSVVLGIVSSKYTGYSGKMFNENAVITSGFVGDLEEVSTDDFNILKMASGEPYLGVEVKPGELFVNSFLVETSLSMRKGCYPGQETVSKIINNKGAAKFPVCLTSKSELKCKDILVEDKKIGEVVDHVEVDGNYYHYALVNREYRVEQLVFVSDKVELTVNYFPLFRNSAQDKALDLFYDAVDEFQKNHNEVAIEKLNLAIEIAPEFEDAYESLGVIYGRIGENHKAIELMKKLSKLNEKSVMAHTNLSLYYMKVGEIELAEEHKGIATVKQFEVLGDQAQAKRDKEQKILQDKEEQIRKEGMFKQVLEIDPEDALANLGMGEIEFNNKNFLASEKFLEIAIATDPKYSVAYLALSKTLLATQKMDKLKEILKKGISVSTKSGDLMPANEMQRILNENF